MIQPLGEGNREVLVSLDAQDYLRQRRDPSTGDTYYLHLSDLDIALRRHASASKLTILDFGCGGSPYRHLFPNADYRRADIETSKNLDFQIDKEGRVNAPNGAFDLVLSTQVLEHCPDPSVYLSEARRVLRPGGKLLLTTHGIFEDHGCPYDFLRWTADGLDRSIRTAGFAVRECQKLTTAGRAIAFLLEHHGHRFHGLRWTPFGLLIRATRRILFLSPRWFHSWCDASFPQNRVVDRQEPGHVIYIALLIVGVKSD